MRLIEWEVAEDGYEEQIIIPKEQRDLAAEEGIGTENKQKVAVRILTNRVSPVLRTPERKPGAENAGQTYFRNRRKNPANRKKIIIAVPAPR